LGLIGPVILRAKIIIQRLWTLQIEWDESLPADLHTEWSLYKSQLRQLSELRIPRHAVRAQTDIMVELHGFCDASQDAYGACVYIRVTEQDGHHHINLLCAKSRVPLKTVSIPRLELCGALLLAQLVHKIIPILDLKINKTYYWTDSTIVLGWIKSSSRKFSTFVANRIGEIQELTQIEGWHHVKTEENPADILSRGAHPATIKISSLWWNGPQWLRIDESKWPKIARSEGRLEDLLEQRRIILASTAVQEEFVLIERFSTYTRLTRVIAMCIRFANNVRLQAEQRQFGPLSAQELDTARKIIIKKVQRMLFPKEIKENN